MSELNLAARRLHASSSFSSLSIAEKLRLLPADLQLLNFLDLYGPATPGTLARYAGFSSGGITVALDRLERAGCIRRRANPADRRSILVSIRATAAKRIAAKYAAEQKQFSAAVAQFTKPELKTILRFFSAANDPQLGKAKDSTRD